MYQKKLTLKEDEIPAIINARTGEVVPKPVPGIFKIHVPDDNNMLPFKLMTKFSRFQKIAWEMLETQVSDRELGIALKLALRAKAFTNSLEPLHPDLTTTLLAEELNANRNTILKVIDKLFKLGVIGKFEVYEAGEKHQKYWVFNPYLAFNGKAIKRDVVTLFDKTTYALISKQLN